MSNFNTRNTILSTLLSLSAIIQYVYEQGFAFGVWYRTGGSERIRNGFVYVIATTVWLLDTVQLGYEVINNNRAQILSTITEFRDSLGRPFVYR